MAQTAEHTNIHKYQLAATLLIHNAKGSKILVQCCFQNFAFSQEVMWCTVHLREEMSLTEFCLVDMGTVGRDHNFDQYRHFFLRPKNIYI